MRLLTRHVLFEPLSQRECSQIARRAYHEFLAFRFPGGPCCWHHLLGWKHRKQLEASSLKFFFAKEFACQSTAQMLQQKSWELFTRVERLQALYTHQLSELELLQRVNDDMIIVRMDRQPDHQGPGEVLAVEHMLALIFRARVKDGYMIGFRSLNPRMHWLPRKQLGEAQNQQLQQPAEQKEDADSASSRSSSSMSATDSVVLEDRPRRALRSDRDEWMESFQWLVFGDVCRRRDASGCKSSRPASECGRCDQGGIEERRETQSGADDDGEAAGDSYDEDDDDFCELIGPVCRVRFGGDIRALEARHSPMQKLQPAFFILRWEHQVIGPLFDVGHTIPCN